MKDLSEELIDFLEYIEHSDDKTANNSEGTLVKNVHRKVKEVKSDVELEVEYMTLLEREREKIEEALKKAAAGLLDILDDEEISKRIGLDIEIVKELRKNN